MRVFITGIAGFLGSHVADEFISMGYEVTGIDNLSGGEVSNVPDDAHFRRADCLDRSSYQDLVTGADIVFHCAATAYDGTSSFVPAHVFLNTAQASVEVATAAAIAGIGRFVLCSSMSRYGAAKTPFTEELTPKPVCPYGNAKYAAEMTVTNILNIHDVEWSIAVPHNIIGPRQKYDDPYRNVASIMINRMLQGKQPVIYGDGSHIRCFSFVNDVTSCLVEMGIGDRSAYEVINIGPDEESTTILELSRVLSEIINFDLDPIFVPDRPGEVSHAVCSSDKARRLLGYETKTSLRDGLLSMVEWIKLSGIKPFDYHLDLEIVNDLTPKTWTEKMI